MEIPQDQNKRASQMWRIISKHIDFRNKRVIDLGCGTGDFLWRAWICGASYVRGVDRNPNRCLMKSQYNKDGIETLRVPQMPLTVEWMIENHEPKEPYDIVFCFSVLPYLEDFRAAIRWMAEHYKQAIIEAQYIPEPYNVGVASDEGFASILASNGFSKMKPIGFTEVKGRNTKRTIWLCQ